MRRAVNHLGQFELYILLALARLGDDAYGVSIRAEIETQLDRSVSHGAIYVTLDRLAERKYVTFWLSETRPVQGGRRRKHVRLTAAGRRALIETATGLSNLLSGLDLAFAASERKR